MAGDSILHAYVLTLIKTPDNGPGGFSGGGLLGAPGGGAPKLYSNRGPGAQEPSRTHPRVSSICPFLSCALYDKTITLSRVLSGVLGVILANHQTWREVMRTPKFIAKSDGGGDGLGTLLSAGV